MHARVAAVIMDSNWRWPSARSDDLVTIKTAFGSEPMQPASDKPDIVKWTLNSNGKFTIKECLELFECIELELAGISCCGLLFFFFYLEVVL